MRPPTFSISGPDTSDVTAGSPPRALRPAIRGGSSAAAAAALLVLAMVGCASSAPRQTTAGTTTTPPAGSVMPSVTASASAAGSATRAGGVPQPAHIVVVVMENHGYSQIIGSPDAPFLNQLAGRGALFTHSYAITHPSEPNYLALFSGSTHGVTGDPCPVSFSGPNLAAGLIAAGKSFAGYAEDLPAPGSPACDAGQYARQLAPWAAFRNVPAAVGQPFTSFPAADFGRLPTVSFVIPGLCYDMHSCSVATGDAWLRAHLGGYANWVMTHDSVLIVTWDEDDFTTANHIATIFVGQQVQPGRYAQKINHYSVLATIEAAYGLKRAGSAAGAAPIDYIWRS